MKYIPRLSCPEKTNKYYTSPSFNPFAYNYNMFKINGNCTSYAYGRFAELLDKNPIGVPTSNAENWYKNVKNFNKGATPKLGSIICWSKGKIGVASDGAGHVAIVEQINDDRSILISESGAHSFLFRTRTLKFPYKLNGYLLQGFIYLPLEFEAETYKYPGTLPTPPKRGYFMQGDRGEQVKNLQKFLNWDLGSNIGVNLGCVLVVDGIIGTQTVTQIKNFQKKYGLKCDGYFGPACFKKMKEIV